MTRRETGGADQHGIVYHHPDEFSQIVDQEHRRWILRFISGGAMLAFVGVAMLAAVSAEPGPDRMATKNWDEQPGSIDESRLELLGNHVFLAPLQVG